MVELILSKTSVELLVYLGILIVILASVVGAIWALIGAVVFLIKKSRVEKFMGAEFDPEDPKTNRRKPVRK
jgi:urea transporter